MYLRCRWRGVNQLSSRGEAFLEGVRVQSKESQLERGDCMALDFMKRER